ncbi:MAG: LysR family transcriptional regulator [Caulobacter sp.]|nr:LysR family transcriptional regulator [Caulobacter sp.]
MDRLSALRLFLRVAETGSFSRAAAEAGVAQSAASRAVSGLEADLGAILLTRTTRRLALTEAGLKACDHARAMIAEDEALELAVRGAGQEPVGLLRVSASVAFARAELVPATAAFLARWPRVRLDLAARDDRIDLIAEGADLAFRLGELEDSRLTARRLGVYPRLVVAAPDFEARHGAVRTPRDLAAVPCISLTTSASGRRWALTDGRRRQEVEIDAVVRTANGDVLADLARCGQGAILAPGFLVAADLAAGRLVRLLPDWSAPPLTVQAVWNGRTLPRKARVYLDFIAARLAVER